MGGRIDAHLDASEPEPVGTIVASSSALVGARVDPALVPSLIDEVPALAVAAAFASGELRSPAPPSCGQGERPHRGARERASRARGGVRELPDGLVVRGGARLRGARVDSHDDHRIAMALAVRLSAPRADRDRARRVRLGLFPGVLCRRRTGHGPCLSDRRASCWSGSWARARPDRPASGTPPRLPVRRPGPPDRAARGPQGRSAVPGTRRGRFRALELEEARRRVRLPGLVVATGGGAFAQPATRACSRPGPHGLAAVQPGERAGPDSARRQPPAGREP